MPQKNIYTPYAFFTCSISKFMQKKALTLNPPASFSAFDVASHHVLHPFFDGLILKNCQKKFLKNQWFLWIRTLKGRSVLINVYNMIFRPAINNVKLFEKTSYEDEQRYRPYQANNQQQMNNSNYIPNKSPENTDNAQNFNRNCVICFYN